jgi:hypothetical protein
MSIPGLTPTGVLPPGIHDCTLVEIQQAFAFPGASEHRREIYAALVSCFADPQLEDCVDHALVDGSFVTKKPDPHDVDVVFGLRAGVLARLNLQMKTSAWPLMFLAQLKGTTSPVVRGHHLVHGFPFSIGSAQYHVFLERFQRERDGVTIKGILRVSV